MTKHMDHGWLTCIRQLLMLFTKGAPYGHRDVSVIGSPSDGRWPFVPTWADHMSATSCVLAVFSLSIVGFPEHTFSSKKLHKKKSKALKLKECEVHEITDFRLICHSHSPDHNNRDFFKWGFLNNKAYCRKKTIGKLKTARAQESIDSRLLRSAVITKVVRFVQLFWKRTVSSPYLMHFITLITMSSFLKTFAVPARICVKKK